MNTENTRWVNRDDQLHIAAERVATIEGQMRAACAESKRRGKTLVYEARGTHHLVRRRDHPVNLTSVKAKRRGVFLVVNGERITRVIGRKA